MNEGTKEIRLNKFLAERLGISRREADNLIDTGRVKVSGVVAKLGMRVKEGKKVLVDGKNVRFLHNFSYLALHKPTGYVCSRKRQGTAPTIFELLERPLRDLKTVGRLDKDSSGLILLTDDGDFAFKMTHPRFYKRKVYEVRLDKDLKPLHQQMITEFGLKLEDGVSKLGLVRIPEAKELNLAKFEKISREDFAPEKRLWFWVEMSEGRNRQIRRTFAALGYTVTKLHRVEFGPYVLGDLRPGEFIHTQPQ